MEEEKKNMKRGLFILFEGADRVGKSTQVQKLGDYLKNGLQLDAKVLRFPDRTTPTGSIINGYLQNTTQLDDRAIHLLYAANRWEAKDNLMKLLNSGTSIVVDRYSYSGVAYTAAKGIDVDWCFNCEKGLPEPDLVIYLKMTTEDATLRGEYGTERYEKVDFQNKIKQIYEQHLIKPSWKVINANRDIDTVSNEINNIIKTEINQLIDKPINYIN
ncbi:thymidylate kinase [Cavenderia fasciculata]|uniref:Thymidylate kinase n=1 Tax=Cavenderia fasciculata TaxID=261658 RepID=F4Q7S8_CACFS|nr:thymidylate kinase [Cavenderia fasciculata]EGG15828.1 thymidylate kinase [Cavenderia fasciculata]|eukprot:XP_004352153.1 thymidylate kinase [Cavenderia fasciculata]